MTALEVRLCHTASIFSPSTYASGCQLITGQPPFSHIKRTPEVLIKMQIGERPRRPQGEEMVQRGMDDKLWNLLCRCWVEDPEQRPTIHEVIEELPFE